MQRKNLLAVQAFLLLFTASSANAVTMLIGDADGFGFVDPNASWDSAQNTDPDTDGDGIIEAGEFLPDLDNDGAVHVTGHDEFDNRSTAEANSTIGAEWTDISLEDYYLDFGDSPANNALFTFTFVVPELGDPDYGVDHFINLIFGDYDVAPSNITVDGTTIGLTTQSSNQDGLVQLAYADVAWADMLDGEVIIDMYAPNEPYVAIDYAYLHTEHEAAPSVPEPSILLLIGTCLAGLGFAGRKKKQA